MPGKDEARAAWHRLRLVCPLGPKVADGTSLTDDHDTLNEYFKAFAEHSHNRVNGDARTRLALAVPGANCPEPGVYGSDEYKCGKCGRIWDRHEDKPQCDFI